MLEEEYEKTRRRLPAHLRRTEAERPFSYEIRPVEDRDVPEIRSTFTEPAAAPRYGTRAATHTPTHVAPACLSARAQASNAPI